jgi:hypothetical protein
VRSRASKEQALDYPLSAGLLFRVLSLRQGLRFDLGKACRGPSMIPLSGLAAISPGISLVHDETKPERCGSLSANAWVVGCG